jgi:hypothetical protein
MIIVRIILLASFLLTARWSSATSATITWTQEHTMCLYRTPRAGATVLIGCYDGAGRVTVRLGADPQQDAAYHPQYGDAYTIISLAGSVGTETAPLLVRPLFLPVVRR